MLKTFCLCQLLLLCDLFATTAVRADAPPAPRFPTEQISLEEWSAYFKEVQSTPGVACEVIARARIEQCGQSQPSASKFGSGIIWIFTREGHPAYPAVVRLTLIHNPFCAAGETTNHDSIVESGHYAGARAAYDSLMRSMKNYDASFLAKPKPCIPREFALPAG